MTTEPTETTPYSDGLPVIEAHRSDFEMRAIGAHARNDWEQERRALDAIHLLDIAERDRGDTTQPQPTDNGRCKGCGAIFAHKPDCPGESAAEIAVAEIRALHRIGLPRWAPNWPNFERPCIECDKRWPCSTIAALDKAGCP